MYYSLILRSQDRKLGGMPGSYTAIGECNPDCAQLLAESCFGLFGPVSVHWAKVSTGERGVSLTEFCKQVERLPRYIAWRYGIVGDLPRRGRTKMISKWGVRKLIKANAVGEKNGFGYTHHEKNPYNLSLVREMNEGGFTINLSHDRPQDAVDTFKATALPSVTVLPRNAPNYQIIDGVKVVACPAETKPVHCSPHCSHTMCGNSERNFIIGFRAHGTRAKRADLIASSTDT